MQTLHDGCQLLLTGMLTLNPSRTTTDDGESFGTSKIESSFGKDKMSSKYF